VLPHFRRIVIDGVGLLGGSLGMALRRRRMAEEVIGLGRSRKRLERARQLGGVDSCTTDAAEAFRQADAVLICLPPRLIRARLAEVAAQVSPGAFVTDVGSVKEAIVGEAEERLPEDCLFIGSHPMAGSERTGVEAARGDLFEGQACFLTPTAATRRAALTLAVRFWRSLGARVVITDPARHDRLVSAISHLPHLAAVALIQTLYSRGDSTPFYQAVIGNGFRDSTRVAAGDAETWEQIFIENAPALTADLDTLLEVLSEWRDRLARGGSGEIAERLAEAGGLRRELAAGGEIAPP